MPPATRRSPALLGGCCPAAPKMRSPPTACDELQPAVRLQCCAGQRAARAAHRRGGSGRQQADSQRCRGGRADVCRRANPPGRGNARIQPAEWQFHAVRSEGTHIAAVGLARDDGVPPVDEDQQPLLANLLDQLALALERVRAEADRREVTSLRDRDRLRSALLSSVGHDLRTPLTAIIGAAAELSRVKATDPNLVARSKARLESSSAISRTF